MSEILSACLELPLVTYKAGETIIIEGSEEDLLYFLVSGSVAVMKGDKEVARTSVPGAIFGEMAALLDTPASASVVALNDCELRYCDSAKSYIEANPAVAIHSARTLAQRLYYATAYLADLKAQFADRSDHFGMMDTILDELLQQQRKPPAQVSERADDPRL